MLKKMIASEAEVVFGGDAVLTVTNLGNGTYRTSSCGSSSCVSTYTPTPPAIKTSGATVTQTTSTSSGYGFSSTPNSVAKDAWRAGERSFQ